jgi:hypothetical protein
MSRDWFDKNAYDALAFAVKRLNHIYPSVSKNKRLEEYVRFKITQDWTARVLLYKIEDGLPPDVKEAIRNAIIDEAKKLRIEVITIR